MSEELADRPAVVADDWTLDEILVRIGQFGRFQCFNFVLLCLPMIFNAFFSISYVFTASTVVHRCNITQCDTPQSQYHEDWVSFAIPGNASNPDACQRYKWIDNGEPACRAENFPTAEKERCGKDFKFRDDEYTIANEFGFFCGEAWKLNMVGTINNVGQFVGIPLGGYFSDRYGRRTMLAIGGSLAALMGCIRSLATTYEMFASFEFLDQAVGSTLFPTAFLLAIELVGPKRRVAAATIITVFYAMGEALLGVLASVFTHWRILLRVLYAPAVVHLAFLWILPESVRWLLSQGRDEQAVETLKQAARINRRHLDDDELHRLVAANREKMAQAQNDHAAGYPIWKACRMFRWRLLNCCLCWFTHTLIALGLSLTSVQLAGNKYHNFMYNGLVQMPALALPLVVMDRLGRRYSLCGSMLICAVCMIGAMFLGPNAEAWRLVLFLVGKFAITCSFQILYFFTSEIFPTMVRNSLLSLCSMVGRIGSMLAPQAPLLAVYYEYAPQLVFGAFALVSGLLTLGFPETANKVLPTTMDEAQKLRDVQHAPPAEAKRRAADETIRLS